MLNLIIRFTILSVFLVGCVHYEFNWTPIEGRGPLIAPSKEAPAFRKCKALVMSGARECSWAFETTDGSKLDIYHSLIPMLDKYLLETPETNTWEKISKWGGERKMAYRFILVSLSPQIVVGIPSPPAEISRCWVAAPNGNCLPSNNFFGSYELHASLPLVTASVWFSPGNTKGFIPIPEGNPSYEFSNVGARARLLRRGDHWEFIRD